MSGLLFDTCAIIHIIRGKETSKKIIDWMNNLEYQPQQIISVVTKAELISFAFINGWQANKHALLQEFLNGIIYVDINNTDNLLIDNYKFIDAYSKNKVSDNNGNFKGGSHVKMGKNDIWIAATAKTLNTTLLTSDSDFDHLHPLIINVKKIL